MEFIEFCALILALVALAISLKSRSIAKEMVKRIQEGNADDNEMWDEIRSQVDKASADHPDQMIIVGAMRKLDEDEASEETKKARDEFMRQRAEGGGDE